MLKRVHMFCSKRAKKGFTLIELLIVVAIIAILAAIAIPQFAAYRRKGYNTSANSDLRNIRTMEESMFADFQDYGAAAVGSGTLTLAGAQASTQSQYAQLSTGVFAVVKATASSGKYTTYTAGADHVAGDTVYGVDSDSSAVFRQPCAVVGACTSAEVSTDVPAAVSGSNDFLAPWYQM